MVAGFGMVGHKLIERLAALGAIWRYDVTVIGEEPHPAYDRVRLTEWLDHRNAARLALARPGWADELGVRALTGTRVVSIDRERKLVRDARGEEIGYDRLVLATGSAPFVPPIEGAEHDGVFVYRTLDDLERLRRRAEQVGSAVVVGGGLLGLEAADALRRLGLGVVLLEAASHLLSRQLDAEAAALLETRVRETGVRTIARAQVRRIERSGDELLALTIDVRAEPLVAGLVVLAAGVRPRDELARDAGLEVAPGPGGIVVDDELRTSDPAVHAIGECASHAGVVYGLAAPGFRMAETLAEILAGGRRRFRGYTPAVRLRLIGIDVWSLGDQRQAGTRIAWSGDGSYRRVTMNGRRMAAAAAVGPWEELGFTQDLIRQGWPVPPWQLHRFYQSGSFADPTARRPVAEWPASAVVCNCLEITRGALSAAAAAGCASVDDLVARTGASRVCGSCRPLLSELTGAGSAVVEERWQIGLQVAAGVAAVLALLIAAGEPAPPAASLRESGAWGRAVQSPLVAAGHRLRRARPGPAGRGRVLGAEALAAPAPGKSDVVADGARNAGVSGTGSAGRAYRLAPRVRVQSYPHGLVPGRRGARQRERVDDGPPARASRLLAACRGGLAVAGAGRGPHPVVLLLLTDDLRILTSRRLAKSGDRFRDPCTPPISSSPGC